MRAMRCMMKIGWMKWFQFHGKAGLILMRFSIIYSISYSTVQPPPRAIKKQPETITQIINL